MASEEGRFALGELLGEGAFGKVFECFDKKNGKKYAMKNIDLKKLSEDERNLAETEAKLLTSLQNEYILYAVTTFQENKTLCIVTEFCDQGDLAQFLERRKGESLDEQHIVEWFRQICSALEYLHGRNVLHRDIKTQNIFLTGKEMTAKLGDFGLAKVLESPAQRVLSFRGSPYYMSPEIYACKPYNSKTDIWAMGVCVYEMVALKLPFVAPQMQQLVYKIINDELPPLPEGYSPELIEIIKRMMCRDTERRPSASELLQDALFKNHSTPKVQLFLPNERTTQGELSTNEDMDKTITDNALRISLNAKRECDVSLPSSSPDSHSESSETNTSDTESLEGSQPEASSDVNHFESTKTEGKAPLSFLASPTTIRSLFRSFLWIFKGSAAGSDRQHSILEKEQVLLQPEGEEKEVEMVDRLTDWKVGRQSESPENDRKPENVRYERRNSGRSRRGIQRPYLDGGGRQSKDWKDKERRRPQNEWVGKTNYYEENNSAVHRPRSGVQRPLDVTGDGRQSNDRKTKEWKRFENDHVECNYHYSQEMNSAAHYNEKPMEGKRNKNGRKKWWSRDLPDERDKYEYFWRKESVFSQWYPCEFEVDGITYNCTEQYMMHQKAVLMDDMESAEIIMALDEPREMRQQGRYVGNFDQKIWDKNRTDVVHRGNLAKFSQNEELKEELLNTYPKTLVEACPMDKIWGIGLSKEDQRAWNEKTWRGQNLLGKVLTKVRDNLMEEKEQHLVVGRGAENCPVTETMNEGVQGMGREGGRGPVKGTMNIGSQEVDRRGEKEQVKGTVNVEKRGVGRRRGKEPVKETVNEEWPEVDRRRGKEPVIETVNVEKQEVGRRGGKGPVKETVNEWEQEKGRKGKKNQSKKLTGNYKSTPV